VNGRWNHIIAALAHIDVIVWIDCSCEPISGCQRCQHLVDIHIGTRTRAGLEYIYREVGVIVRRLRTVSAALTMALAMSLSNRPSAGVGLGGRLLNVGYGMNEETWHGKAGDREVLYRTLRLGSIQCLRRNFASSPMLSRSILVVCLAMSLFDLLWLFDAVAKARKVTRSSALVDHESPKDSSPVPNRNHK
jgi:hypothetical protein